MDSNRWSSCVGLSVLLALSGCSHKQPDAKTELEKAAAAISDGSQTKPPPAPVPAQPTATADAPAIAAPALPPDAPPAQQIQQALVAYKSGQFEDAVTRLHKLRASPNLTAEQRMALQDSVAAVMAEVYALAEKGDTRAIAAVRQYEDMQTAPRQ